MDTSDQQPQERPAEALKLLEEPQKEQPCPPLVLELFAYHLFQAVHDQPMKSDMPVIGVASDFILDGPAAWRALSDPERDVYRRYAEELGEALSQSEVTVRPRANGEPLRKYLRGIVTHPAILAYELPGL